MRAVRFSNRRVFTRSTDDAKRSCEADRRRSLSIDRSGSGRQWERPKFSSRCPVVEIMYKLPMEKKNFNDFVSITLL